MMRLTKLPEEVQAQIASGKLSAGHARALIGVPDPAATAKRIIAEGLNVRQVETLVHDIGGSAPKPRNSRGALVKDADTLALEKRVGDILGLSVKRRSQGPERDDAHQVPRSRTAR